MFSEKDKNKKKDEEKPADAGPSPVIRTFQSDISNAQGTTQKAQTTPVQDVVTPPQKKDEDQGETDTEQEVIEEKDLTTPAPQESAPVEPPPSLAQKTGTEEELPPNVEMISDEARVDAEQHKKTLLEKELVTIEEEQKQLAEERKVLFHKKKPLEQALAQLQEEHKNVLAQLAPIKEREGEIEKQVTDIETKEQTAKTPEDRHSIEQRRWEKEDERRKTEEGKWVVEKQAEDLSARIGDKNAEIAQLAEEEKKLDDRGDSLEKMHEKKRLEISLVEIAETKERLEVEWKDLHAKKESAESKLTPLVNEERELEIQKQTLDESERAASSVSEEKDLEEKRWQAEKLRRAVEEKRWGIEKELAALTEAINKLEPSYKKALAKEEEVRARIEELS